MPKPNLPKYAGPVNWIGPDDLGYQVSGLIHCVRLAKEASATNLAPAAVMLHGWQGNESAMWIFKHVIPPGVAIITPRAPIDCGNEGYVWFRRNGGLIPPDQNSVKEGVAKLAYFLAALPDLYPIDPDRSVLIGFSQGAAIGNCLVLSRPGLVRGVASLSGLIPEVPVLARRADRLTGLPVFIAHGTKDDIVPLAKARLTRETYVQLGAEVTYGEYPVGHKVNTQGLKALKAWLAEIFNAK